MQSFEQQLEQTRADEKARRFADMFAKMMERECSGFGPPGGGLVTCGLCGATDTPRIPCTMPSCPLRPLGGDQ